MADHINISDPYRSDEGWRSRLDVEKLKAEIKVLQSERDHYRTNLDAIFTRIGRGEPAELHYANGDIIRIGALPDA